ncbi:hypothetical protein BS78_05G016600 [Paspalum vaginatum]|nr:hypothetical protein BS78_05G016600 [Paspalum vaginatum]
MDSYIVRRHTLTCSFSLPSNDLQLTITNVYAPADHSETSDFLEILEEIHPQIVGPWLVVGDFNLIRDASDKNNPNLNLSLCRSFNDTIHNIGVQELPLLNCLYTWTNKHPSPTLVRLDRAFVNHDHSIAFPSSTLTALPRPTSDHKPLLVTMSTTIPKSSVFRFENAWLHNPVFLPSVLPAWQLTPRPRDAAGNLARCLKSTRAAAKVWARRSRAPPAIISNCKFIVLLLDHLEDWRILSYAERQVRDICQEHLHRTIKEKAAYWKQRSKHRAICEGDANTAFHHAHATARSRSNLVHHIECEGQMLTSHEAKTAALIGFYKGLLGTERCSTWDFDINALYSEEPRASYQLTRPFEEKEVLAAIKRMNRSSAPAAWPTVRHEIMCLLEAFHNQNADLEKINRSYMVLLPKKPGANSVDSFRPICLQNCSVKIIAKVMTSRLQTEINGCCHKRKVPTLVLKLDFAKAFDTVNWDSLMTVLEARGFNSIWRDWILHILRSSKIAVLLNGCPGPWFGCKQGLRQGDPLSPYLFLLVADVLQSLIKNTSGIRHPVVDDAPCPILQYADDTLILLRADLEDVSRLRAALDSSSSATGLKINYSKSTMVPMHVDEHLVASLTSTLGCKLEGFPQRYLGLPLSSTKLKLSAFDPHIAKTDKYLAGWQACLLNPMGRTVLVNSVLSSQLVYAMCALQIPPGVLNQMDCRRRAFLWSGEDKTTGASCLVAWESVCTTKGMGGLNVKDLRIQNLCLLLKLLHRLHTATESSWAAWVREGVNLATLSGALKDDLATMLPALYSHCTKQETSVHEVMTAGVKLAPRLSSQAACELDKLNQILHATTLTDQQDKRFCIFADQGNALRTGGLYNLLKNRGDSLDLTSLFIWQNRAPPRGESSASPSYSKIT